MKRPVKFAIEVAAGLVIAAAGAWLADRFSRKQNRQAQAAERTAAAMERIADAMEGGRAGRRLPRPSMLQAANIRIIRPDPEPEPCGALACGEQVAGFMRIGGFQK